MAVGKPLKDLRKILQEKETSEQDEHRHNNRSRDVKSNKYYESDRYYKNRKNYWLDWLFNTIYLSLFLKILYY